MESRAPPTQPNGLRTHRNQRSSLSDFHAQNPSNGPVPVPNRPPGLNHNHHSSQQHNNFAGSHSRNGSAFASNAPPPLARSPPNKNTTHVPCKFFKQGNCQAGAACPFDHSMEPEPPCKYFMKGNCKFGAKCALAHILPDGRRVNKPHISQMGGGGGGGRHFYAQHPEQNAMYSHAQAGMPASQAFPPHPFSASEDNFAAQSRLGQRDSIPGLDGPFGSPTGSNFGSPPTDSRLPFSPKGLTALETPFPASFDSSSISLVAQHHKKFGESVPTTFNWGPLNATSPTTTTANQQAFGNLNSLARADKGDGSSYRQLEGASSPPSSSHLLSPRLRAADAQPRRIIQSDRRATSYTVAHSMGARPQSDEFEGIRNGPKADEAATDDDELAFGEDLVPHSLSELLTPQEKMRRFSRSEQDHGLSSRPPRSGYGSPPLGSPSHNSPSRYGALFANRQQQQQPRNETEGVGPSPFGHVGSPLRKSSFGGRAVEGGTQPSPSLGAISRLGKSGDVSPFPASPTRSSGVGLISEQLRKARLGGSSGGGGGLESAGGFGSSNGLATPSGPTRTISSSSIGSPVAETKAGRLDRAMSSTSVGRERIDEEDCVFSMEDDEEGNKKENGGQGEAWSGAARARMDHAAGTNGASH